MDWELHLGPRVFRVGPSGLVIGRASDADVVLSDALVSRRHAVVRAVGAGLEIEDLESRQGIRVNGVAVAGRASLKHGDRIAICAQELAVVFGARARSRASTREATVQMPAASARDSAKRPVPAGATGQASPVEVLLAGAEDALARGDHAGSDFALARLYDLEVAAEDAGGADGTQLRRYAICALRAAKAHGEPEWIDAVIDTHRVRPRVMHAATADALEGALEALPGYDRSRLRTYVAALGTLPEVSAYEQFCLERLRVLAR